ncbi:MAG: sugar kinase, partial [Streptomyces sp.]|nr:sugar kinase [Streptomyces sp.]
MGDAPARGALGRSVGSGDAFAAGPIHGLLAGTGMERALAYGTAHGALVMTTPGDV